MPCYDGRDQKDAEKNARKVDILTDMLCSVLTLMGNDGDLMDNVPKDIRKWWAHHQKIDQERSSN